LQERCKRDKPKDETKQSYLSGRTTTSSRRTDNIETLSERLGSLQIEVLEESTSDKRTDIEMSVAPALAPMEVIGQENSQAGLLKNIVPDPGWFDSDQMKFEDWWRRIHLFLKSNRVVAANKRITVVLARLRGGIAGIYT